ncbi:hypothetical protein [Kitasatospora sp. NPDC056531]|uniref:hypothetical protein n=1 Tax=Kitasatospora sp. NPDC056531 TaxID=3345856 RepID=UPI003690F457
MLYAARHTDALDVRTRGVVAGAGVEVGPPERGALDLTPRPEGWAEPHPLWSADLDGQQLTGPGGQRYASLLAATRTGAGPHA